MWCVPSSWFSVMAVGTRQDDISSRQNDARQNDVRQNDVRQKEVRQDRGSKESAKIGGVQTGVMARRILS